MSIDPVCGVILAGGQSRRFGSDKALYPLEGMPLIERAYQVMSEVASPVFVSVASEHNKYAVPAHPLYDAPGHAGPLAGICAGLEALTRPWLLVLAVDMPFVTPDDLEHLLDHRSSDLDAVIAHTEDRMHPLCACYHRRTLPILKEHLNQGHLTVKGFVNAINSHPVKFTNHTMTNMNYPDRISKTRTRNPEPESGQINNLALFPPKKPGILINVGMGWFIDLFYKRQKELSFLFH